MSFGFSTALTKTNTAAAASLMLDMLNGQALDPRITFTNASTTSAPTYFGSDGRLATMGANQIGSSESPAGFPNTTSGQSDPLGGTGAFTSVGNAADTTAGYSNASSVAGATYTGSVWLRVPSGSGFNLNIYMNGGGSGATQKVCALTTTWQRFNVTATATTTASYSLQIGGGVSWGNGVAIQVFGAQIEQSATMNTYSKTTGTPTAGPRSDYDPSTPLDSGARGPELVTNGDFSYGGNLQNWSGDLSAGTWAKTNCSAVLTTQPCLTGGFFTKITENTSTGSHYLNESTPTLTAGQSYVISLTVMPAGRTQIDVAVTTGSQVFTDTIVDLTTLTKLSGTGNLVSAVRLADGSARIALQGTASASAAANVYINTASGGTNSYTGDGVSGLLVGAVQLELGAIPSLYTATTSAPVPAPGWTPTGAVTIANGYANFSAASQQILSTANTLTAGKRYALTFTVANATAGLYLNAYIGSAQAPGIVIGAVNGTKTVILTAITTTSVIIQTDVGSTGTCSVTGITLKEVIPATTGVDLNANAWVANGAASVAITGTTVTVTKLDSSNWPNAQQSISNLTSGKSYYISASFLNPSGATVYASTNSNTADMGTATGASGTVNALIHANSSTMLFQLGFQLATGAIGGTITFSNITIQEVVFTPKGQLIEEARTNLLLNSRDFTNASWAKTDTTVARTQVGIDGAANTACLLTEGTLLTAATSPSVALTVTAGSVLASSFVFKRGNTDWVCIELTDSAFTNGARAWFNLSTGAKGSVAAFGTGTGQASAIQSLGGGWYRCSVTATPSGAYTQGTTFIHSASADASVARVSGATYIVDCAGLEVGAWASSIIVTGASTVTRAADIGNMVGIGTAPWFNAAQGTFVAEANTIAGPASVIRGVMSINDGTSNNKIDLRINTASLSFASVSGVGVWNIGVSPATGAIAKMAVAYSSGSNAAVSNGGTVQTSAQATMPAVSFLQLGGIDGASNLQLNGWLRRITYYPKRLSDAQLQSLTT